MTNEATTLFCGWCDGWTSLSTPWVEETKSCEGCAPDVRRALAEASLAAARAVLAEAERTLEAA